LREAYRRRVFGNRKLKKIFGPERDELTGKRRLRVEELYDLYSSSVFIWVIKSKRMGWLGHVARMEERRGAYRFWWENLRKTKEQLGDLGLNGSIILKRDLQEIG